MYNKAEKELPAGWALDAQGKPSKNAGEVLGNIVGKRGGGAFAWRKQEGNRQS